MQILANGKRHFHSIMEFYVIHLNMKGENFYHSSKATYPLSLFLLTAKKEAIIVSYARSH